MSELWKTAIEAAKETPRGYFAPAIALWLGIKWLYDFTDKVTKGKF